MKPGYKQTEVGVIPEEWEDTTVGAMIAAGIIEKPLDGNHGNIHPKSGDFVDWGIPFVMANNVQGGGVDLVNCSFIRKQQADSLQKGFSITGDVLLTHKATIGNTAVVGEMGFPYIMLTPQVTYYRVNDESRLSNLYLRYYFDTVGFQSVLRALAGGGTRSYIGISAQHQLPVIFPTSLPEQRAIAEVLSDVDGLLGGLDRLIAKKRDLKQAAMQQLLTAQTRLPGFHGEWGVKTLGEVVKIQKGQLITSTTLQQGDIPVIAGGKQPAYFHATANRLGRTITISASGASAGYVALYNEPIFASDCSTISESKSYCLDFIFYQLLCKQQTIYKAQTGGAQPHIHAKDLNPISFEFTTIYEQTAIAQILSDMDAELTALEQRREKTRALKQAMMQELLTGRTRLV
jgi:type I restriction enzyme S subunit